MKKWRRREHFEREENGHERRTGANAGKGSYEAQARRRRVGGPHARPGRGTAAGGLGGDPRDRPGHLQRLPGLERSSRCVKGCQEWEVSTMAVSTITGRTQGGREWFP